MVPIVPVVPANGGSRFNGSNVQRRIDLETVSIFENVTSQLGLQAAHRDVIEADGSYALREPAEVYGFNLPPKVKL